MSVDPSVIAAIEAAVAASPDNLELRAHLAELLVQAERFRDALYEATAVLSQRPDHVAALRTAALASASLGDPDRAASFGRLADALGGSTELPPREDADDETDTEASEDDNVVRLRVVGGSESTEVEVETSRVTLADVAGMEDVKRRLNLAFLAPMRNPEMRRLYGKSLRGGLMLFGPPGCGKTFIARATAGELGARFISVGLADVLDMWLGESERKLHDYFELARRSAPCVLFFDEIDAIGQKRSHLRNHGGRTVVNQLLTEMDSVDADNEGVFVLAATNHPWDVDSALRRPGRFDRMILVLPPDEPARRAILAMYLADRPAERIDFERLAKKTDGFSGADIKHLCDSAAELAMEESIASGTARPIVMKDFEAALRDIRPSTRAWFDTARNYAQFANEGGAWDDLLAYMRANRLL